MVHRQMRKFPPNYSTKCQMCSEATNAKLWKTKEKLKIRLESLLDLEKCKSRVISSTLQAGVPQQKKQYDIFWPSSGTRKWVKKKFYVNICMRNKVKIPARALKKCTLFERQCIQHEQSNNWGHYCYVSYWRRDRHFKWSSSNTRRSSRLQGKGSAFGSNLF